MNKQPIIMISLTISFLSIASCGTIGGVGKDLSSLGQKMVATEHRNTATATPQITPYGSSYRATTPYQTTTPYQSSSPYGVPTIAHLNQKASTVQRAATPTYRLVKVVH